MAAKTITVAELEVMRLLWRGDKPWTFAEIRDELMQTKNWKQGTIKTLVFRLREKGVIEPLDKYGAAQYVPLVTEDEYVRAEVPTFVDRVFEGNALKLAASLCKSGELTESDIDELKTYFKVKGGDNR
jgi:BlaI family penicillinase repressor